VLAAPVQKYLLDKVEARTQASLAWVEKYIESIIVRDLNIAQSNLEQHSARYQDTMRAAMYAKNTSKLYLQF
jgi:hypothetical protein